MPVNKSYNSGVCYVCREIAEASSFAARRSAVTWDDLEILCKMDFADNSIKMEDSEYANQMGYKLSRKISIRRPGPIRIDTECSVVIGNTLYHVSNVDYTQTENYMHLTEVGEIAGRD